MECDWLHLTELNLLLKPRVDFLPGWILWLPDVKSINNETASDNTLELFDRLQETLSDSLTAIGRKYNL